MLTDNTVLAAIYIEPPADVRSVPQNYTIHCITTGESTSSIIVGLFVERQGNAHHYSPNRTPPVSGYNQTLPVVSTLNSTTLTYDYSEEVVWSADKVVVQASEFEGQGLSRLNGDHDWACAYPSTSPHTDVVQTYIRGEKKMYNIECVLIEGIISYHFQLPTSLPLD